MLETKGNEYWDMVDDVDDVDIVQRPSPTNPEYIPQAQTQALLLDQSIHTERSEDEDYTEARAATDIDRLPLVRSDSVFSESSPLIDEIDAALSDGSDGDLDVGQTKGGDLGDTIATEDAAAIEDNQKKVAEDTEHTEGNTEGSDDSDTSGPAGSASPRRGKPMAKLLRSVGWKPDHASKVRTWARKSKEVVTTAGKNVRDLNPNAFDAVATQTRHATETSAEFVKHSSRRLRDWDAERLQVVPATRHAASVIHSQSVVFFRQIRKFEADHRIFAKSKAYLEGSAKTIQRFVRRHMQKHRK